MGSDSQPYIYEATLQHKNRNALPYTEFNPRAYTQASYASLQARKERESRPKPTGPLINFNQHPDSYKVASGQNMKYEPMPENTKKKITTVRWAQLGLRVIQELGSLGLLVCVICIKGMPTNLSWIFRIAPAWGALLSVYAIYHLARKAKSRPAASSASYHLFALFMDTGMVPFYVFIALFSYQNLTMANKDPDRWTTLFSTDQDTSLVLLVSFAMAIALGGLHVITAALGTWLVIVFRKISKLPPDMNPLEDNLTARPSRMSKHKYKDSEVTLTSESISEKDWKYLSGSTLSVNRYSHMPTDSGKGGYQIQEYTQMPFKHTRTGSDMTFSPHNPDTARLSPQQLENGGMYEQPYSARASRKELPSIPRTDSAYESPTTSHLNASIAAGQFNTPGSQPASSPRRGPYRNDNSPARYSSPALPNAAPTNAHVKSQQKQSLLNDSWYVSDGYKSPAGSPSRNGPDGQLNIHNDRYGSSDQHPLRMNPPTPLNGEFPNAEDDVFIDQPLKRSALTERADQGNGAPINRSLTVHSSATEASSVYSESAPSLKSSITPRKGDNTTPKGKYYGNLAAATAGVRGMPSNHSLNAHNSAFDATGMSAGYYGFAASPPPEKMMRQTPQKDGQGRVISRTGADIADQSLYPADAPGGFGMRERRDVSGKVAEEGRGGGWFARSRW